MIGKPPILDNYPLKSTKVAYLPAFQIKAIIPSRLEEIYVY